MFIYSAHHTFSQHCSIQSIRGNTMMCYEIDILLTYFTCLLISDGDGTRVYYVTVWFTGGFLCRCYTLPTRHHQDKATEFCRVPPFRRISWHLQRTWIRCCWLCTRRYVFTYILLLGKQEVLWAGFIPV